MIEIAKGRIYFQVTVEYLYRVDLGSPTQLLERPLCADCRLPRYIFQCLLWRESQAKETHQGDGG